MDEQRLRSLMNEYGRGASESVDISTIARKANAMRRRTQILAIAGIASVVLVIVAGVHLTLSGPTKSSVASSAAATPTTSASRSSDFDSRFTFEAERQAEPGVWRSMVRDVAVPATAPRPALEVIREIHTGGSGDSLEGPADAPRRERNIAGTTVWVSYADVDSGVSTAHWIQGENAYIVLSERNSTPVGVYGLTAKEFDEFIALVITRNGGGNGRTK